MSPRTKRERVEAAWRQKLHAAEQAYGIASAKTRQIQAELPSMPSADGSFALQNALRHESQAMNEYANVLQTFTRLILYGELPEEALEPEPKEPRAPSDLDIQEWVAKHHGFVPHPSWIGHCRELYLGAPAALRTEKCPPDKRSAIREAFVELGILS